MLTIVGKPALNNGPAPFREIALHIEPAVRAEGFVTEAKCRTQTESAFRVYRMSLKRFRQCYALIRPHLGSR